MAIRAGCITYLGTTYDCAHLVRGADYVRGYDLDGSCIISIEGIRDFSNIIIEGDCLSPDQCLDEPCNTVRFVDGAFMTVSGTHIMRISHGYNEPSGGKPGDVYFQIL